MIFQVWSYYDLLNIPWMCRSLSQKFWIRTVWELLSEKFLGRSLRERSADSALRTLQVPVGPFIKMARTRHNRIRRQLNSFTESLVVSIFSEFYGNSHRLSTERTLKGGESERSSFPSDNPGTGWHGSKLLQILRWNLKKTKNVDEDKLCVTKRFFRQIFHSLRWQSSCDSSHWKLLSATWHKWDTISEPHSVQTRPESAVREFFQRRIFAIYGRDFTCCKVWIANFSVEKASSKGPHDTGMMSSRWQSVTENFEENFYLGTSIGEKSNCGIKLNLTPAKSWVSGKKCLTSSSTSSTRQVLVMRKSSNIWPYSGKRSGQNAEISFRSKSVSSKGKLLGNQIRNTANFIGDYDLVQPSWLCKIFTANGWNHSNDEKTNRRLSRQQTRAELKIIKSAGHLWSNIRGFFTGDSLVLENLPMFMNTVNTRLILLSDVLVEWESIGTDTAHQTLINTAY